MRYLVLSDIHGNRYGLEAVLADAQGLYDQILCLGDVVGYGAHPNECCEILRDASAWSLQGNHDAAALGLIDISWFNAVASAAILWTRDQLSPENRNWLQSLKPTYDNDVDCFQAVHGSLREPLEEYIIGPSVAQPTLQMMVRPLCFYGHTHVADCYRCLDVVGRRYEVQHAATPNGGEIVFEPDWKYLINPGSCGQPRDGNPQARYAIYDLSEGKVCIYAVDYPCDEARQGIINAGLPQVLGDRLLTGR